MNNESKVTRPVISTRAMASLLAEIDPAGLDVLKERFPEEAFLFGTEYVLGEGAEGDSIDGRDSAASRALKELINKSVGVAGPAIAKIQAALISRLSSARKMRLVGSIFATICSAGAVATLATSYPEAGAAIAGLSLFGSISMLAGEHLEKPVLGGGQGLGELLSSAIAAEAALQEIGLGLLALSEDDARGLFEIARKVNGISAEIRRISVFGGVPLT